MQVCPECKYERTLQDNLLFPDYECPSCGIIFEKDKARQELAALEKQRLNKRKAKQEKLKKEEKRKRKEKEEQLKRQEQQRNEAARLQELEAERESQEKIKHQRREEKEKQQKETEQKQLQEQLQKKRQEKITQIARENPDKIVSRTATEKIYQLFDICPFGMVQTGKGLSIVGFAEAKNKWQHARCIQKYCRLWTIRTDGKGAVYAQGCSMQFLGLSKEEITRNFSIKNMQILEDECTINRNHGTPEDQD
jgi:hypothetical protein